MGQKLSDDLVDFRSTCDKSHSYSYIAVCRLQGQKVYGKEQYLHDRNGKRISREPL